jgi:hypothetical protein
MPGQPPRLVETSLSSLRPAPSTGSVNPSSYPGSFGMAFIGSGGSELPTGRIPFTTWAQERVTGCVRFYNLRLDHVPLRSSRTLGPRDNLPATGPEEAWKDRRFCFAGFTSTSPGWAWSDVVGGGRARTSSNGVIPRLE